MPHRQPFNMFALYHSSGFYYAPVTKGLLGGLVLASLVINVPLQSYRYWFTYTYSTIWQDHDILRFLGSRLIFTDPKDVLCAAVLLYHFRIFERRYGSHKFASFIFGTFTLSLLLELALVWVCNQLHLQLDPMPSGPYGGIFPLFVPFFCDIPRVAITHVMGVPFTGKSLNYIIGLQMASGCAESLLLGVCGILAGLIYCHNVFWVQSLLQLPMWLGQLSLCTIGHLVDTPPPADHDAPLGATLEIQRQQHIERLEQQMMYAQIPQQQQQHQNLHRWFGFGNQNGVNNQPAPMNAVQPQEDQVQRLIEMGFNRDRVLQALRLTNNDVSMATNVLLTGF